MIMLLAILLVSMRSLLILYLGGLLISDSLKEITPSSFNFIFLFMNYVSIILVGGTSQFLIGRYTTELYPDLVE
jgi:hypothetical protein